MNELKAQLIDLLSNLPEIQITKNRLGSIQHLVPTNLRNEIDWEGSPRAFVSGLVTVLESENQTILVDFLQQLADSDWLGWERSQKLKGFCKRMKTLSSGICETIYSTLFPVEKMPSYVYATPCQYNDSQTKEAANEIIKPLKSSEMYPFLLRGGRLLCFQNLKNSNGLFSKLVSPQNVERYEIEKWCQDPEQMKWFISLLNRSLNKLTGRKGLNLDKTHHRYYFVPKEVGQPLEITYRPLNNQISSRKVVWQPEFKKERKPKPYWYHLAVALKFNQVSEEHWCLSIRPEMRVTKDGVEPLEAKKIGGRVTHKKSREFNYDLLENVNFWRDFLSDSKPRIIFDFGSQEQNIIVSTKMLESEIEWPGIPEKYAKPFKNIDYQDGIFSWYELEALNNEGFDSCWDDLDSDDELNEEFEDD